MKNFGETLANWYLRLNGFFLISNFVIHRSDAIMRSADTDLLAVRFPYVYEEIGGQDQDWDAIFQEWGLSLDEEVIGLIVEVKTGRNSTHLVNGITRAFGLYRLMYGVQRLGMWPRSHVPKVVKALLNAPFYRDPERASVVGKLLITDNLPQNAKIPPCFLLSLEKAEEFIEQRIQHYITSKYADRLFFPSDLLQFLIWKLSLSNSA